MPSQTPPNKALHIFYPGKQTASDGRELTFTAADLEASAKAYDPTLHEAPLVIGHPDETAPAYGWVKSLSVVDGDLVAEPHQVEPAFAEAVNAGRYKKRSASFYLPNSDKNPVPGVFYLRHVGFLGAAPPALKGLREFTFSASDDGVVEFTEVGEFTNASLWNRLRDWLIETAGLEKADQIIPDYAVKTLESEAQREAAKDAPALIYNEPPAPPEPPAPDPQEEKPTLPTEQELQAKEADLARREQALKDAEAQTKRTELASFCDGLVKGGKVLKAHQPFLVDFMAKLPVSETVEFGEGDAKTTGPALDQFKKFLAELPQAVSFKEEAPNGAPTAPKVANFSAPAGEDVDAEQLELHQKALTYQQSNPNVSYVDAVIAVGGAN